MKACVKAWQNVINSKAKKVHDEFGLKALDAFRYGPVRLVETVSDQVRDDMVAEFDLLYPDFKYDCLEIITDITDEPGGTSKMKFYKTADGQIVINGTEGTEIIPNTVDAAFEKHVPVIEHSGDHVIVKVGSVAHPMLEAHYITCIILETATGYQRKDLKPGDAPEASFAVTEPVVAAYEYCNLHGLWKADA